MNRAALVVGAVTAFALAVLAGAWLGRGDTPAPRATQVVRAGDASLVVPRAWRPVTPADAGIDGLAPERTAVLAPSPGQRVVVTLEPVRSASLLPRALAGSGSARETRFAGYRALRYPAQSMDVTVLPTSAGALTVACLSPAAGDCAAAVESVSLRGAAVLAPAPDLALALRLPCPHHP